jgi:hypothetical protein
VSDKKPTAADPDAMNRARASLRLVCATLPHLAGLAAAVRLYVDDRVSTAAVTRGGRVLVNPQWFGALDTASATFVMAHELLHLCLRTHERDILVHELGQPVPANGLAYPGARDLSAEQMVQMIRSGRVPGPRPLPRNPMTIALQEAGLLPSSPADDCGPGTNDVLGPDAERELFPDEDPAAEEVRRQRIDKIAERSLRLGILKVYGRCREPDGACRRTPGRVRHLLLLSGKASGRKSTPLSPVFGGEGLGVRGSALPRWKHPSPPTPLPGVPGRGEKEGLPSPPSSGERGWG